MRDHRRRGNDRRGLQRRLADQTASLVAAIVVLIGLGLLYVAGNDQLWKHRSGGQAFVTQLGSLLIVAVGLAVVWDWRGKRALAEEVLERAQLAADLTSAGIRRVTTQYLVDVEWQRYFQTVSKLDVFFAYGRTWRRTHYEQLRTVAARKEARIRVILPNPDDAELIDRLANRFSMMPTELVTAINEARAEFLGLRCDGGASIRVLFHNADPTFSCYRFDHVAILTLYSHSRKRRLVPTFVCEEGGTLYDFLRQELDELIGQGHDAEAPTKGGTR